MAAGHALRHLDRLPVEARGVSAMRAAMVTNLQRGYGNQAVQRLLADHSTYIQRHGAAEDPRLAQAAQQTRKPLDEAIEPPKPQDEREVVQRVVQREVGIAKEKTVKKYTEAIQNRLKQKEQMRPIELLHLLTSQVQQRLKDHKVHEPTVRNDRTLAKETGGFFAAGVWEIRLNEELIKDTSPEGVKHAAAAAYHEARHTEQWFNLIRHVIYVHRETNKTGVDNPLTVRSMLGGDVNQPAIDAALQLTQKTKKFDKSVKQIWARSQYEERFDPAPDQFTKALGGKRNPKHKQVMDALDVAGQALTKANEQKETFDTHGGSYPLKTEGWHPAAASRAQSKFDEYWFHHQKLGRIREQIASVRRVSPLPPSLFMFSAIVLTSARRRSQRSRPRDQRSIRPSDAMPCAQAGPDKMRPKASTLSQLSRPTAKAASAFSLSVAKAAEWVRISS